MALYGARLIRMEQSPWILLGYWSVFLFFLLVAMYAVLVDVRYIRMQYKIGQREIFEQTLGSEEFRRALRAAQDGGSADENPASSKEAGNGKP